MTGPATAPWRAMDEAPRHDPALAGDAGLPRVIGCDGGRTGEAVLRDGTWRWVDGGEARLVLWQPLPAVPEGLSGLALAPSRTFAFIEAAMSVTAAHAEVRRARIAVLEDEDQSLAGEKPDDPEHRRGLYDVLRSAVAVERTAVEHLGALARA